MSLLRDLKDIIDNEKYVIIDIGLKQTIMAVPYSLVFMPKGRHIDFNLKKKDCDMSLVEFKPPAVGKYRVDFEHINKSITNSPCFINVYDTNLAEIIYRPEFLIVGTENFFKGMRHLCLLKF